MAAEQCSFVLKRSKRLCCWLDVKSWSKVILMERVCLYMYLFPKLEDDSMYSGWAIYICLKTFKGALLLTGRKVKAAEQSSFEKVHRHYVRLPGKDKTFCHLSTFLRVGYIQPSQNSLSEKATLNPRYQVPTWPAYINVIKNKLPLGPFLQMVQRRNAKKVP